MRVQFSATEEFLTLLYSVQIISVARLASHRKKDSGRKVTEN